MTCGGNFGGNLGNCDGYDSEYRAAISTIRQMSRLPRTSLDRIHFPNGQCLDRNLDMPSIRRAEPMQCSNSGELHYMISQN